MNDCSRRGREGNTAVHNIFAHIRWSKGLRGHRHYWCTVSCKSPVNAQQPEPLSRTSGNYEQKSNLRSLTGNPESGAGKRWPLPQICWFLQTWFYHKQTAMLICLLTIHVWLVLQQW